jgi:hypothetical protein
MAAQSVANDEAFVQMYKIITSMFQRPESYAFREPVDWKGLDLKDYPDIVKHPRDLGSIRKRIENSGYDNIEDIAADVRLDWSNCMLYNRDGSEYYHLADTFARSFEEAYNALRKLHGAGPDPNRLPTVEERIALSYDIFKIENTDMARVLTMIEAESPSALARKGALDEVLINFDALSASTFFKVNTFVLNCLISNAGPKLKKGKFASLSAPAGE